MVRVWYPAEVVPESNPVPYFTSAEIRPISEVLGALAPVPWFFSHADLVESKRRFVFQTVVQAQNLCFARTQPSQDAVDILPQGVFQHLLLGGKLLLVP